MNAAAQSPDGDLPGARRRLDIAIASLIEPRPETIKRDNGTTEIVWVESWMEQLLEAVSGQTGERSGGQSSLPVWADVCDKITEINTQVRDWHPEFPLPDASTVTPTPTVIARLQAIQARKWAPELVSRVVEIATRVEGFTLDIRQLLSPAPAWTVYAVEGRDWAACPQCGKSAVYRPGPEGKPVRHPALQIQADGTPHCVNRDCRTIWPNPQFLARLLGFDSPEGVLE